MFRVPLFYDTWFDMMPKSIQALRCDDIQRQLEKHNMTTFVHRTSIFGERYYVIGQVDEKQYWHEQDIAKALDIPIEWVDLAYWEGMRARHYVKEEELNDLYFDNNTRLRFNKKNNKDIKYIDKGEWYEYT